MAGLIKLGGSVNWPVAALGETFPLVARNTHRYFTSVPVRATAFVLPALLCFMDKHGYPEYSVLSVPAHHLSVPQERPLLLHLLKQPLSLLAFSSFKGPFLTPSVLGGLPSQWCAEKSLT